MKIKTIKNLEEFCHKNTKKKIDKNQDLFSILDSLELMSFLTSLEKECNIKINMIKIFSRKTVNLNFLLTQLK
tara:strand:- start:1992 stop:2210 length:219 start_codon:yes stop_codon:yes gene_type:complete